MVLKQRGTRCSSVWCCGHWLSSAAGLVTEGHHHGTTVPGPSKSFPLQSCGGVNEHEGLWGPQPWTQDRTDPQGPPAAPPASHPCPGTWARTHPLCPLPAPALGRAPCAWGSLGWWWSLFVVVVIFNLCIVLDLRQRQQVGETCLALGAQRGKVGNALQLHENTLPPAAAGSGRAGLSRSAHPEDCSSFYSLLALSPKSQALRMSKVGKKGLSAPEQAQGLVLWGCSMVASSRPVGQELILPLGMRDPTSSHPPLHCCEGAAEEPGKSHPPLEAQKSQPREPGAPCVHQTQQGEPSTLQAQKQLRGAKFLPTATLLLDGNKPWRSQQGGAAVSPQEGGTAIVPWERHEAGAGTW
ncbi:uncharacterized protein LOC121665229 [Corvus kubaryi]|uniref:uncharacterized protein LOC121665229 n=1 Tax=Corvus kubaryi TaxID=68294 RepID=UPI001C04AACF|nr:uncharacterized protein LOC121665229 [Corvus kubaryi]